MTTDPRFWQLLLTAELPWSKSQAILAELSQLGPDRAVEALRHHSALSPGESKRIQTADFAALDRALADGARVMTADEYPESLAEAEFSAAVFVHGNSACLNRPTVGIVGTRNASTYGKACAQKFAQELARAGVCVISGGALGIDAAAHRGALSAGGHTAAVLAAGIDNVYPAIHGGLFQEIKQTGCLVSQFAVGTRPAEYRFLQRNDLVAALSQVLLVIECPEKSGALRTAHAAADLGRDVFVVPANISDWDFRGSFNLIRDGATLVYHPGQILEALGVQPVKAEPLAAASTIGQQIMAVLNVQPIPAEKVVEKTGLETSDVLSELTMLELEGHIIRDAGGYALKP